MKQKIKLRIFLLTLIVLVCSMPKLFSQNNPFDINFEFQAYPTGLIPGIRLEKGMSEKSALHLRVGYNWVNHRDLGVQDDEKGDGFGFTLGWKRYFKDINGGLFLGARSDIWFNSIDWTNVDDIGVPESGTTDIIVVQPTLEGGYLFVKNKFVFAPTVGFGYEINVKTSGKDVGEGAILLIGINIGYRI